MYCGEQVEHLNGLQEQFGPRGLTVVGVTDEGKNLTEKWIGDKGAKYAYGYDKGGKLMRAMHIGGFPSSVLIDPNGEVVWSGHPAQLTREAVEGALEGALTVPVWDWPPAARSAKQAYLKGELGKAIELAGKLEKGDVDVAGALEAVLAGRMKAMRHAHETGDYLAAVEIAGSLADDLKDRPEGAEAKALLDAMDADDAAQRVMKGQKSLARLAEQATDVSKKREADAVISKIQRLIDEYPGTIVETRGRELVSSVREALRSNG